MAKSPSKLQREIDDYLAAREIKSPPRNADDYAANTASGRRHGTGAASAAQMRREAGTHEFLLKNVQETFVVVDRDGKILATGRTPEGAKHNAPEKPDYVNVRGEYTSDGSHWGIGRGRVIFTRSHGRWQRNL